MLFLCFHVFHMYQLVIMLTFLDIQHWPQSFFAPYHGAFETLQSQLKEHFSTIASYLTLINDSSDTYSQKKNPGSEVNHTEYGLLATLIINVPL